VTLVYSEGPYGGLGADAFKNAARKKRVCIATEEKIPEKADQRLIVLKDIVANIVRKSNGDDDTGARVVVLFAKVEDVKVGATITSMQQHVRRYCERRIEQHSTRRSCGWHQKRGRSRRV
jgi:hypothetical protein